MWQQCLLTLKPRLRGFHLVTDELVAKLPMLADYRIGMAHLLLQHTSASLTLNENCDPSVRSDMEAHLHMLVPEDAPYYRHTYEGADDMPAHIKSSLLGVSLLLPIRDGQLALGTWQGIWLGEHRVDGGARKVLVTLQG
ncbi:secondary thiamine-phosphate synthase enzyme YjbQ, partial [Aeromonas veronii]|uniref:secondary thiamine-phosphate synthase enzyme YjbQ n=1 Tax=Aeromonas veronii TaxID=654 RepID=UPI003D210CDB